MKGNRQGSLSRSITRRSDQNREIKCSFLFCDFAGSVLAAEGGFDVLFINQADVLTGAAAQLRSFADVLPCPVVYGSLARGAWRSL